MIKLSIIVPVYNIEKYIRKCVESLIATSLKDIEIILVNDGSSDGSLDIIREYEDKDSRIVVINKKNGGCASARNTGIFAAKGEYIGFVDGDDFVETDMFEKLLDKAYDGNNHGIYDYVYCGYREYYEDNEVVREVTNDALREPYTLGTNDRFSIARLVVNTRVAIWRAIYKKEVIKDNEIFFHEELKRFDDLPFRVEYLFTAKSAACVPLHMYNYRLGREGQDVSCHDNRLFVHFEIFEILDHFVDGLNELGCDSKLKELLQIVKICTHGYALSKIDDRWRVEYCRRAKLDLNKNFGYLKTVFLIFKYTGKGNLFWYTRLMIDNSGLKKAQKNNRQ